MCGIVGLFAIKERLTWECATVRKMAGRIAHRGPDDDGFYDDQDVALGFRRLSIIDLESGHQPIHNEDRTVWTVFNGEIYNYKELRASLEKGGHSFYTQTDTEVLVHLYEQFGEQLVHHLRGMFVFAIWDARKRKLLLFRDRLGIKPAFYAIANGHVAFASEMKALLESGLVDASIDVNALDHYLGLQYVPAPATIYRGISKRPPGHFLSIAKNGEVRVEKYWDVTAVPASNITLDKSMERYEALLAEAVALHLRRDVPLGAFLSGGVDSSAVVAMMAEQSSSPVNTFTICSTDKAYDESQHAKAVAERFGTTHRTLTVGPQDFLQLVPSVIEQYDEPFADSSALPTYIVSKLARQHVKVVLSGDGGDETCAGYKRYADLKLFHRLGAVADPSGMLRRMLRPWLANGMTFSHGMRNKALKLMMNILSTDAERHYFFMSYFRSRKAELYGEALKNRLANGNDVEFLEDILRQTAGSDLLRKVLNLDIKTYLADDILYKVDIASMANSLEVRVPLLDHKLEEFTASIPSRP